jgi:hypothetical protein
MFAHFTDAVESRGGARWWNTNFAENAHISACKTTYKAGNKQVATLQPQLAANFERRRVMHETATGLGVEQNHVRAVHVFDPYTRACARVTRVWEPRGASIQWLHALTHGMRGRTGPWRQQRHGQHASAASAVVCNATSWRSARPPS